MTATAPRRTRAGRLAVALTLAAAFAVVLAVLGCGPASSGAEIHPAASSPVASARLGSDTPVVLIILDELPNATLMTADGRRVDARRYPRIAEFASTSTWYRDNVAGGDFTAWAVPSILTGNLSDEQTLPTAEAQPDNIFTLLGPGRRVHGLETVTELCPRTICPDGHQGEAPDETMADEFIKAKFHRFEPADVNRWIRSLPKGRGTLSVAHVEVPHQPHRYLPDGRTYPGGPLAFPIPTDANGWTIDDAGVAFVQQRHLLQAGFADRIVGHVMSKIKRNGDFRRAMIVLTADHGYSFDPADLRRDATPTNVGATVNPPLFVKYPGETEARTSTASTQSIDILPTIAGTLGAEIPETDGIPVSEARPDRVMTVSKDVMRRIRVTAGQIRAGRREELAEQIRRLGTGPLWRLGPRSGLIGRRPGRAPALSGASVRLDAPSRIRRADASDRMVPSLVSGVLRGVPAGGVIALAWNGRIVATTRSFVYKGPLRFGAMVPPAVMKRGRNRVGVYAVAGNGRLRLIR